MSQARILTDLEYRRVLLHISKKSHAPRNKAILYMNHLGGMRCGEIASLKISDVLTSEGKIKDEIYLTPNQTKGNRSRTVVLCEKLQKELFSYLCARFNLKELKAVTMTDTTKALFYSAKNSQRGFSANTLSQWFGTLFRQVGIEGASSHSGRRFFATKICENGVNPKIVQNLLGHRQLQTTMLYYEVSPKSMRSAVELMS
jgi:integrase/recombinase XerD